MAECGKINDLPVLTTCPDDAELVLFFNVPNQTNGMALRTWATLKSCFVCGIFGTGSLEILGSQLDGDGVYLNSGLIDNLMVFACNIPNYLEADTQWEYVRNGENEVVGVKILIGFGSTDRFIIIPNPTCA